MCTYNYTTQFNVAAENEPVIKLRLCGTRELMLECLFTKKTCTVTDVKTNDVVFSCEAGNITFWSGDFFTLIARF